MKYEFNIFDMIMSLICGVLIGIAFFQPVKSETKVDLKAELQIEQPQRVKVIESCVLYLDANSSIPIQTSIIKVDNIEYLITHSYHTGLSVNKIGDTK